MEIKKSKITKVEMLKEWSNPNGTFFPHKVTFENGDVAIANKKTQNAYSEGQEIQYTLDGVDALGNKRFKEHREDTFQGKKKQGSNASFALAYAKDWAVAKITAGTVNSATTADIIKIADRFNKWLNEN